MPAEIKLEKEARPPLGATFAPSSIVFAPTPPPAFIIRQTSKSSLCNRTGSPLPLTWGPNFARSLQGAIAPHSRTFSSARFFSRFRCRLRTLCQQGAWRDPSMLDVVHALHQDEASEPPSKRRCVLTPCRPPGFWGENVEPLAAPPGKWRQLST